MLGNTISGYRILAAAFIALDPDRPIIALLEDTHLDSNWEGSSYPFIVVQLKADGTLPDGDEWSVHSDEQMAWEDFSDRSA